MRDNDRPIREELGLVLKRIRESKGMSQEALAEKSKMHRSALGRIENGKFSVGIDLIYRIIEALDCEIDIKEKE